ncbi:MAG: efflux RND transporter permease subunit, partial [Thermoanaerobaculia bacterium]
MNITEICIRKPVFAWMIMLAAVVFGAVAASRIGISQYPDVDFPTINIGVSWEGAAPEVIEHDV